MSDLEFYIRFFAVEVILLFEAHVECQPNLDPLECEGLMLTQLA